VKIPPADLWLWVDSDGSIFGRFTNPNHIRNPKN